MEKVVLTWITGYETTKVCILIWARWLLVVFGWWLFRMWCVKLHSWRIFWIQSFFLPTINHSLIDSLKIFLKCIYLVFISLLLQYRSLLFFFGGGGGCHVACRILVLWPSIGPMPPVVKAWSPNHWTAREFPGTLFLKWLACCCCLVAELCRRLLRPHEL